MKEGSQLPAKPIFVYPVPLSITAAGKPCMGRARCRSGAAVASRVFTAYALVGLDTIRIRKF